MGSVTEARYCALGERCKLYDAETGKSQKLGRYHKSTICDRCRAAGYRPEDATPTNAGSESPELEICSSCRRLTTQPVNEVGDRLCGRCTAVFSAARTLFKEGVTDEREIVPTLAFAAHARTRWTAVNEKLPEYFREVWPEVFAQTYKGFKLVRVVAGVPVLRQESAVVEVEQYSGTELPRRIYIRAFSRSAKPKLIETQYERTLLEEHISYDRCKQISFPSTEVADAHLIIAVGPDRELTPKEAGVLSENPWRRRPSFPPPSLVRDYYKMMLGSVYAGQFKGYSYALPGRQSGPKSGEKFLTACLAAHVNDHNESSELRPRAARLMNRHVLEPCNKPKLQEDSGHARDYVFELEPGASHHLLQAEYLLQQYLQRDTPPSALERVFAKHPLS
jgi:hypothetical protein